MHWLETKKLLATWTGTQPYKWLRYIDDVFFIWQSTTEELDQFIEHLNSQHIHIKFTATYNSETRTIPFLDMDVTIEESGLIETDLHTKPTARCQYLLPSSSHPNHVHVNIPFSLGYRILRICSKEETCLKRLEELRQKLLSREYPAKVVDHALRRVKAIPRSEALKRVDKKPTERETLVVTYHPSLPSVTKIVQKHWSVMVDNSQALKRVFGQPSMVAYKRGKNIGDILIRAKFKAKKSRPKRRNLGYMLCNRSCKACALSGLRPGQKVTKHKSNKSGQEWNITSSMNCQTSNVVYRITCKKCPSFVYIGETSRRFCQRLTDHRGYIHRRDLETPIGKHFNLRGHSVEDFQAIAIEKVLPENNNMLRKQREKLWINRYDSVQFGANSRA